MKKRAIAVASALLLTGCSGSITISAPTASTQPATPATLIAPTASADIAAPAPAEVTTAASVAPSPSAETLLSTAETCAVLDRFYRPPLEDPEAEQSRMDAVEAEMRTLPERASEDLKDILPPIVAFAGLAIKDGRSGTRELNTYMHDPAVAKQYQDSIVAAAKFCPSIIANE